MRAATLVILAGGGSRRMGSPKALLEVEGLPMVLWLARRLGDACGSVLVSTGDAALACGLPAVGDRFPGAGPLAGVEAGLRAAGGPILAVACDMPLLTRAVAETLLAALPGFDAAVPLAAGALEPGCAAWAPSALPALAAALEGGERRMLALLERLSVARVPFGDQVPFTNVNTPADYAALLDARP